jgi:hypothetical protein
MRTLIAVTLACWLCALLATPRRPLAGSEVQELVYSRLLGRHQRLVLLACAATVLAGFVFFATLAQHAGASANGATVAGEECNVAPTPTDAGGVGGPYTTVAGEGGSVAPTGTTCYRALASGEWVAEQVQADGTRRTVATWLPDSR